MAAWGRREIARAGERLASLDKDGDGKLTPAEVPDRIAIQVLRSAQAAEGMATTADYAPARPAARSGPAWFQRMDTNGDGDVSPSEFLGTAALRGIGHRPRRLSQRRRSRTGREDRGARSCRTGITSAPRHVGQG